MTEEPGDLGHLEAMADLPAVLLAALEHTRSATCITTAELDLPGPKIVYVNPAYCRMTGRRREDVLGATPRQMQGPLTDRRVLDQLRADLSAGRRFSGETVNYRADGSPFVISWSIDPVRDEAGTITHFVATQEDVTDKVRTANRLAAEKDLDQALTNALTSAEEAISALQGIVNQIAVGTAEIAVVGSTSAKVVDEQRSVELSAGLAEGDGEIATFSFSQPGSATHGELHVSGLGADDLDFLDRAGLARYAERAGAVTAALVEYQRQRHAALRLQHSLLPRAEPSAPGFTVVSRYAPGAVGLTVGGDWYDVVTTPERTVFTVGDVSGSGVDAAVLMGRLRLLGRVELERGVPVTQVLKVLSDVVAADGQMATMLAIDCDRVRDSVRIWSAGHLPPVLFAPGSVRLVDIDVAPPLGFLKESTPPPTELGLDDGAGLLLFTDGLVERRGEPLTDGLERLVRAIRPEAPLHAIVDDVLPLNGPQPADDVAVLALRRGF